MSHSAWRQICDGLPSILGWTGNYGGSELVCTDNYKDSNSRSKLGFDTKLMKKERGDKEEKKGKCSRE